MGKHYNGWCLIRDMAEMICGSVLVLLVCPLGWVGLLILCMMFRGG